MNLVLGGSSSITAFNLSRLGASVTFAGVIGQDFFGQFVEERLTTAGVDVSRVRRTSKQKTGLTIWHSLGGRRAGVTFAGTIAMLAVSDIKDEHLQLARHLHMGSYFLQESFHEQAPEMFRHAKKMGLTTSLDCNYDPAERWDSNIRHVLRHIDVFFPNDDEALRITRQSTIEGAARELSELAGVVVIKRGADGVLVTRGTEQFSVAAVPVKVVDTTGAGDSFDAGFLSRFVKGGELRQCIDAGLQAAAKSVQSIGGTAAFE